jgi:hypothetical protein
MLRRLGLSCKAQSAVELALILPVLTLLLLGIMEGGRIFSAYVELQHVAREGARYASMKCTSIEVRDDQVPVWVTSTLVPWLESRLSMLRAGDLSVEFVRNVSADGTEMWVELDVSYPLQIETPLISDITGNPFNLQSKMVMRSE